MGLNTDCDRFGFPLLRKLRIPIAGGRAFRHFQVEARTKSNAPIETIKEWMSYGSEAMIRRYSHLCPDSFEKRHAFRSNGAGVRTSPGAPFFTFVFTAQKKSHLSPGDRLGIRKSSSLTRFGSPRSVVTQPCFKRHSAIAPMTRPSVSLMSCARS
jgi:hypothetical protein